MRVVGEIFALLAAAANGTIGSFNRWGFSQHANFLNIAFFKCAGAWGLLSVWMLISPVMRAEVRARAVDRRRIATLAFFGIFILYFFETWAFVLAPIPLVAFLLYASGIVTVVLGVFFLDEKWNRTKAVSVALVSFGVYGMFSNLGAFDRDFGGALLAITAGTGYSIYLLLGRKFSIPAGLGMLWWLFGFGTLYLLIPFVWHGCPLPPWQSVPALVGLVLLPTIGGFYFTNCALERTEATRVQVIETLDPVFASLYALALFGDTLPINGWLGAGLIFIGVLYLVVGPRLFPGRGPRNRLN